MLRKICTEKLNAQMPQATERISLLFIYSLVSLSQLGKPLNRNCLCGWWVCLQRQIPKWQLISPRAVRRRFATLRLQERDICKVGGVAYVAEVIHRPRY